MLHHHSAPPIRCPFSHETAIHLPLTAQYTLPRLSCLPAPGFFTQPQGRRRRYSQPGNLTATPTLPHGARPAQSTRTLQRFQRPWTLPPLSYAHR